MKFPQLSTVLIDEWPQANNYGNVEICLFTRPIVPPSNMKAWNGRIYTIPHTCLFFRRLEKYLNKDKCFVLPPVWKIAKNSIPLARVECIPNGESFASALLLIHMIDGHEEKRVLYAGTFFECNDILLHPLLHNQTVEELYLDNLTAGSILPSQINETCEQIRKIRTVIPNHTIYIWMNLCGYEALLLRLARQYKFKIELPNTFKAWFHLDEHRNLFEYSGDPEIIIVPSEENHSFSQEFYQKSVAEGNFQIRLTEAAKFPSGVVSLDGGLIHLAYSRHPDSTEIKKLLIATKPKRIYPLYPADEIGKMIQNDWLPAQCQLVQHVYETELTEVTSTQRDGEAATVNSAFTLGNSADQSEIFESEIFEPRTFSEEIELTSDEEMLDEEPENESPSYPDPHSPYIQLAQDAPQNCGYTYDGYASSSPVLQNRNALTRRQLIELLEAEPKQPPRISLVQPVAAIAEPVIIIESEDSD